MGKKMKKAPLDSNLAWVFASTSGEMGKCDGRRRWVGRKMSFAGQWMNLLFDGWRCVAKGNNGSPLGAECGWNGTGDHTLCFGGPGLCRHGEDGKKRR